MAASTTPTESRSVGSMLINEMIMPSTTASSAPQTKPRYHMASSFASATSVR